MKKEVYMLEVPCYLSRRLSGDFAELINKMPILDEVPDNKKYGKIGTIEMNHGDHILVAVIYSDRLQPPDPH